MPRPRIPRRVWGEPNVTYFKPAGVMMKELDQVILTVDEFEAMRLKDYENMEQIMAAKKMKISQPTFQRLLLSARKKVSDAIVNGKAIRIEGGHYKIARKGSFQDRGNTRGFAAGSLGECVCTKCKHKITHQRGMPCYQIKCPKCGTLMTRG